MTDCSVIVAGADEEGFPVYWETVVENSIAAYRLIHSVNTDRLCVSMYSPRKERLIYSRPGETEFHVAQDEDQYMDS